jgi:hypothetical protein
MDVSNREVLGGEELIQAVISMTGLPENLAQGELERILRATGHDAQNLTLDDLRQALVMYLETLHDQGLFSAPRSE